MNVTADDSFDAVADGWEARRHGKDPRRSSRVKLEYGGLHAAWNSVATGILSPDAFLATESLSCLPR
jgi:hypothetical protein